MSAADHIHTPPEGGTYRVTTYGCQMNEHESEKIAGMLEELGMRPAPEDAVPDVLVLNTCCVRDSAEQRIIGHIGTLKKVKEEHPQMRICVAGCLAQQPGSAEKLARTFPFLDLIVGTHRTADLRELLLRAADNGKGTRLCTDEQGEPADGLHARRAAGPLAFTNIMYGCDNFCSYCIVPYVRGRERSRPVDEILRELQHLAAAGYREVTLLGQNVNSYRDGDVDFAALLRMAADTDLARIRFMTSHPKDLSGDLIRVIAEEDKVCSHIHLPVQSGSTTILESMNRRYTKEDYLSLVGRIRGAVPDIVLTTDIIVGYPGETEADFADTMDLVERVRFDSAFTFVYSPRTGTRAASLPDQVPKAMKKQRIMELIERQNAIAHEKNEACVGKTFKVLVEGPSARGAGDMCGRTDGGKMVNFVGSPDLRGQLVPVKILEAKASTLFGRRVEENEDG